MADKNVMFRTSMGGFNKADVTEYIDKQNAEFRKVTQSLNGLLAEKDAEIAALKERAEKAEAELSTLSEKEEKIKELEDKAAGLELRLSELGRENGELEAKINELESKVSSETSENERKAGLYDDMSSQVGDILISANRSADGIIAEANAKAAKINEKAASDAEELRLAFTAKMAEISEKAKNGVKASAEEYRAKMRAELNQLRAALTDAVVSVDEKSTMLSGMADELEKKLNEQLDGAVAKMEKETDNLKTGI